MNATLHSVCQELGPLLMPGSVYSVDPLFELALNVQRARLRDRIVRFALNFAIHRLRLDEKDGKVTRNKKHKIGTQYHVVITREDIELAWLRVQEDVLT